MNFFMLDLRFFQHVVRLPMTDILLNKSTAFRLSYLRRSNHRLSFSTINGNRRDVVLIISINKRTRRRFQQHGDHWCPRIACLTVKQANKERRHGEIRRNEERHAHDAPGQIFVRLVRQTGERAGSESQWPVCSPRAYMGALSRGSQPAGRPVPVRQSTSCAMHARDSPSAKSALPVFVAFRGSTRNGTRRSTTADPPLKPNVRLRMRCN